MNLIIVNFISSHYNNTIHEDPRKKMMCEIHDCYINLYYYP